MEPLFVDTNLEYEMDMTLFPGWNDDFKRSEPQLLVHSFGICYCDFNCEDLRTDTDQDCSLEINPFEIIGELKTFLWRHWIIFSFKNFLGSSRSSILRP